MSAPDVKLIATARLAGNKANPIQIMKMADAFAGLGSAVEVIIPGWRKARSSSGLRERFGTKRDFRIVHLPSVAVGNKLGTVTFALSVLLRSRTWRKDAVLITRSDRAASVLARVGKDVLFESHTFAFPGEPVTAKYRRRVRRLMDRSRVAMIAISERLKALWTETGVEADRIFVAHDGVDLDDFRGVAALPIRDLKCELGLPLDRPVVGYVGSLGSDRGIDVILEAAAAYADRGFMFLIVGGTEEEAAAYRARARSANVIIRSHVINSRIPMHLRCADLLVMPYRKTVATIDGCSPMKVFEYLASGRAILAPYFASYHEVLKDFPGVTIYDPDDDARFISEIGRILADPARRGPWDRLASLERYSWKTRAETLLDFYARHFPHENP